MCVHCGAPPDGWLPLRHRLGQLTREVDVPLCGACRGELQRLSGDEERWRRLGRLAAGLTAFVVFIALFLLLPAALGFLLRFLPALVLALGTAALAYVLFRRASLAQARPEKQAIWRAAQLRDFSWHTATLAFAEARFAERFHCLNEGRVLHVATNG
jgi:hypothetical protein